MHWVCGDKIICMDSATEIQLDYCLVSQFIMAQWQR